MGVYVYHLTYIRHLAQTTLFYVLLQHENKSLQTLIDVIRIPPDFARYDNLELATLSYLDEWKCNVPNVLSEIRTLFFLQTQGDDEDHKLVKNDEGIRVPATLVGLRSEAPPSSHPFT